MSKAFEPRIGRTLAKAMGRNRHGLQLERAIQAPLHAFELFDEGNKPIHGGVVVVRVLKKGNLLQKGINLEKVNNKDQVKQNHEDAELHKIEAALQWQRPGGLVVMMKKKQTLGIPFEHGMIQPGAKQPPRGRMHRDQRAVPKMGMPTGAPRPQMPVPGLQPTGPTIKGT